MDEDLCLQCIEANRDMVIGVKLRLSTSIANNGKHEMEAYRWGGRERGERGEKREGEKRGYKQHCQNIPANSVCVCTRSQ